MNRCTALVLLFALGCGAPATAPPAPTAPVPARAPAQRPPGTTVEVLLAGSPPQQSLARSVDGTPDTQPFFLGIGHYGPPKDESRKHYASLAAEPTDDGLQFVAREGEATLAEETVQLGPYGRTAPVEAASIGMQTALDALTIPLPERALGKGAVWIIDRPLGDSTIRTTVELSEVYADGYKLVLQGRLLIPTEATDHPTVPRPPPSPDGRQWTSTAEVWVSSERLLPARAYGQLRRTTPVGGSVQTDVVDWSLDAAERPE
ncbi:MAG: hypothetical protein AAGA54_22395 [Myxococcota bacterium]